MMNLRKMLKNQKGFTLIELMIVVVIIGVLAAIAIPRFQQSAMTSRGSRIAADLRTVDSAIQQAIANGHDVPVEADIVPFLATGALPTPPTGLWRSSLLPADQPQAVYTIDQVGGTTRYRANNHTVEQIVN